MSGPWDDFKPAAAPPAPGAPAETQPWQDFKPDAPAAAPPPAKDPNEVRSTVVQMMHDRKPFTDIQDFVTKSGYSVDPKSQDYFAGNYQPGKHYDVNVSGPPEKVNALNSAWHGLESGALRGYDDEWNGLWGAVGNELGSSLGLNKSDASFGDRYTAIRDAERATKDAAFQDHPIAYGAGFVPGALTGPSYFRAPGATLGSRLIQAAVTGAIEGGLHGSGNAEGGVADRLASGAKGSALGSVLGVAAYPLGVGASSLAARVGEHLRPANSLNSGLDVLASRAPQNADDMAARAAEMRSAGVDPRLVDVVDEGGRGIVRSAAAKNTPARQDLADHADQAYIDAQSRVANQARQNISEAPSTARQLASRIKEEQTAMGPRFDAVRNQPVAVTNDMLDAFSTSEGHSVLRAIGRYMTPVERKALDKFQSAISQVARLDPRLPDGVRQQLQQQIMEGAPLTVDIADKFGRIITDRAKEVPAMGRVAESYSRIVRGAAREQHPEYDQALTDFEKLANVKNAAEGTRQFEDAGFLDNTPHDVYSSAVSKADPNVVKAGDEVFPSEQTANAMRARDEVVDSATGGSGQRAMGVARQISRGSNQHEKNVALLGEEGAAQLESGMRNEVRRVDNTRYIDPRIGSKTAPMSEDAAATNEGIHFVADAATHGKWGLVRGTMRWLRGSGIRGVDAERLVRDAISEDQTRVNSAIEYLGQKGLERSRASGLVRQLRRAATKLPGTAAGAAVSSQAPAPAPNSIRAIMREDGRVQ